MITKNRTQLWIRLGTPFLVVTLILVGARIILADPPVATSTSYQIFMDNVATFGQATSTSYSLDMTVGEPTLGGEVASTSYRLRSGYIPPTDADVAISKTVTPTTATPGQWITYTLTFSNTGQTLATGVVITDIVPVSVTNTTVISSGVAITLTNVGVVTYTWEVQDLAADRIGVITITGQLSATLATGTFTNTAVITTTGVDSDPGNNSSEAGVTVVAPEMDVQGNDVSIDDGDTTPTTADATDFGSTLVAGGAVAHTFTISNSGDADLNLTGTSRVTVTTDTHFSVSEQPAVSAIGGGDSTTFKITFDPSSAGSFQDTVNISNNDADENPYTFVISGTGTAPDLAISKTVYPPTAAPSDPITYTITFSNTGTALASGVVITDIVPVSVTNTTVISSGVAITQTNVGVVTYTWEVQDLVANQSGFITITGQLSATLAVGTFTNTAVITTTAVDANPGNNSGDAGLTVTAGGAITDEVETATGTGTVEFRAGSGGIEGLAAVAEATLTCPEAGKPGLDFVHGFFSFNVTGLTVGETVVVTITLPFDLPAGSQYWKCHEPEGWIQIPMGSNDGDNVITITLVDGGLGDDDGVPDGVIVDPGGPGQPPPQPPVVVGGIIVPVSKLGLAAPWMGLAAVGAVGGTLLLRRRRRR